MPAEPVIRHISDTAYWAAYFRARETERPDALFRDPFAERLSGERGRQISAAFPFHERQAWSWATRTWLFDRFLTAELAQGADMVVNLAAGLDARPYRLPLPPALQWIEVDLPAVLAYKQEVLAQEEPACRLERVALDLGDLAARRQLFQHLGGRAGRVLVISEGLLIYLTPQEVAALAQDLAAAPGFLRWAVDIASPGLLRMLQKQTDAGTSGWAASLRFAPPEGPNFFVPYGWRALEVRSTLKTAARLKRLNLLLRLMAVLPENPHRLGSRPWSASCLLAR